MEETKNVSIRHVIINRIIGEDKSQTSDVLSIEEPLEIRIDYVAFGKRVQKNISVTMRTPGNDLELAMGFLFTEGIFFKREEVKAVYHVSNEGPSQKGNIVVVELSDSATPNLMNTDRNFYTTSSCGVCGKGSIQSIRTNNAYCHVNGPGSSVPLEILYQLPKRLRTAQSGFTETGGIHAAGLFNLKGELILLREDVGRHNALDKLIGGALERNLLPLNEHILLLSGRASFELIQKATMAGIPFVAAIGAPSSLAVELADDFEMTLIGFLKDNRFNVYCGCDRVRRPKELESM